ncbi:hypothetical protein D3C75_925520 [compost metagenome]
MPVLRDPSQQLPFQLFACQLQLQLGGPLVDERLQQGFYQCLRALHMLGRNLPFHGEQAACTQWQYMRVHAVGQAASLAQLHHQARLEALSQNSTCQGQGQKLRIVGGYVHWQCQQDRTAGASLLDGYRRAGG